MSGIAGVNRMQGASLAFPQGPGTGSIPDTDKLAPPPRSKDLGSAPQTGVGTSPPDGDNGARVTLRIDRV